VRKKLTSRRLLGKIQATGGEIKAEKQAHFTDIQCKVKTDL
jgi:hypothetical protein